MSHGPEARDRALDLLRAWTPPDPGQETLRQGYVDHLVRHDDGLQRGCPDHLTASTLVMSPDGERVLLTLHAKAQQWFQLGGHVEPEDADLAAAARREALEESGLEELRLDPAPLQLDVHEVPFCAPGARHLDVRFLAVVDPGRVPVASDESAEVRWWPVTALPSQEVSLEELVRLALRRLDVRGPLVG